MQQVTRDDVWVKPTNWCCMGPWPQPDCEHVLSHFHADCDLCRKSPTCPHCREQQKPCGRVHSSTRVWGKDPEEVRGRMAAHINDQHPPAEPHEEGRLF